MSELRWNPLLGEWLATATRRQDCTFLPPADFYPHDYYHFHIEFYAPLRSANRLKCLAGSETGAGMFINDTLPEEKAAEIRAHVEAVVRAGEKTGQ